MMYHFIVNPNSRSGLGKEVWNEIEKTLNLKNINYEVYFTKYQRHATKLVRQITSDGEEHTIVALGGDGTIGEVANGIVYPEKTTLGYIPIGSGNDFAHGIQIPKDTSTALDIVLYSTRRQKLNLGVINYGEKKKRFVVSSGFGYDAAVGHKVTISKLKKLLNAVNLGKLAYAALSLNILFITEPAEATLILDDEREIHMDKMYFTAAMNLPYEGGGCKFCPKAKSDDDYLDIITVSDIPKIGALPILLTVFAGLHTIMPGVHVYRCKKAEVISAKQLTAHTDGEPIFQQDHVIYSLEENSTNIILPEKS